MFTEEELWKIIGLVNNQDYEYVSDYELGLKVLSMLPDSENKTFYHRSFSRRIKDIERYELEYETQELQKTDTWQASHSS